MSLPAGASPIRFCARHGRGLAAALVGLMVAGAAGRCCRATEPLRDAVALPDRAIGVLRNALADDAPEVRLRAAESLLMLDYPEGVRDAIREDLDPTRDEPARRIVLWRVMARATPIEQEKKAWIERIRQLAFDASAPDHADAAESLALLRYAPADRQEQDRLAAATASADERSAIGLAWVLARGGDAAGEARLVEGLASPDAQTRLRAARALQSLPKVSADAGRAIQAALGGEPAGAPARAWLAGAAAVHAPGPPERTDALAVVRRCAREGSVAECAEACRALAALGTSKDLPLLEGFLEAPDPELRIAAASAVLRIGRRDIRGMAWPDWVVIALYMLAMLAVGWYYSRRTKSTEDYLLGGRTMRPLSVGLSLFATLMSTITYLMLPGEVIRNGPMVLAMLAAFPFVYLIAGWLLIPFIMRLRVTSAYEILETRLGVGVRLLGSFFFLLMRLLWMAAIIYATTSTVLVPLAGLPRWTTPLLCALLGAITVVYTSMGGLRAVVVTDVTQTIILFGAAVLTLVLVSLRLGGVESWFPTHWPAQWPEPTWGFNLPARMTFLGAMLAHFTWWICTAGSDQMAIQRYLATRDARAARGVLATSLLANVFVYVILAAVGMALLAYFRLNPHLIPDGATLLDDADRLFPHFIACGMPPGLSGLVVAGLLAAAMSSLSSGVNSSCSVITVDFIDRFRRRRDSETDHVKLAKLISVFVGVAVVALSSGVGMVGGNLLELAFKVVNLLTAPLFGLFFMAMFVRRATAVGTFTGAAFGTATVVLINYWETITGSPGISFLWAMPLGLLVQVATGVLASLLPLGRRPHDPAASRV